jgi:hypothetical protein
MYARCVVLVVFALVPAAAAAQSTDAPRVSIGAGAGVVFPYHGDFDFTPWAWDADFRVAMARRMVLEIATGEWRHSATSITENIVLTPPPGVVGRLERTTRQAGRMLQVNVLFSGATGRVRVNAGGGIGLLQHQRRTQAITSNCSAGVPCGSSAWDFSRTAGTAQAVGGLEVGLGGGFAAQGHARFIVAMTDPGGSELRVTAGVRWSLADR